MYSFDSCDWPSYLKLDSNHQFFSPCDLEIWWMTSKNNRALLLYYVKLCASFQIHQLIQTGVTVRKRVIRFEIDDILSRATLKFDGWLRTSLPRNIKRCASFHCHMYTWIQTGVAVRKQLSGVMAFVTLTFDLWPWPSGWASHLSLVITPENFRMIWWWEHSENGVTGGQTDRRLTDGRERPFIELLGRS